MTVYKYSNGIFGPKVRGYKNEERKYNLKATEEGLEVYSKDNKLIHKVADTKDNKIYIHTLRDCLGIQNENKKTKTSKFYLIHNNEIIKESSFTGELSKSRGVIVGSENVYFKKFTNIRGNRFYYQIVKDNDVPVTPEWQVIQHESQDDGLDRFYCENYREVSRGEYLEEDDADYRENLEEVAVYLSDGRELFYQSYNEYGESENLHKLDDCDKEMLLGASLVPLNPIAGSAVMLNAALKKKRENDNSTKENSEQQNGDDNSYGM
ncbi:MAG: hypothetical protein IJX17_04225 [Clostridia bacterium]|nr:hypothetical protein [Clostridia bacterium]